MKLKTILIIVLLALAVFGCWYVYSSYQHAHHHKQFRPHTTHTAPTPTAPTPSVAPPSSVNTQAAGEAASVPGAKVMSNGDVCFYGALPKHVGTADLYPDPKKTPGCVRPAESMEVLCTPGHSSEERHTSQATKDAVFDLYGIPESERHGPNGESLYEIDHFIPLVIGGADRIENLFPQRYDPHPGARDKDTVERFLRDAVCKRHDKQPLEAQLGIRGDWYALWQEWNARPHGHRN